MNGIKQVFIKIKNLFRQTETVIEKEVQTVVYKGYLYTADGEKTSIYRPKRVKNDKKLSRYKVVETKGGTKVSKRYTIARYLVEGNLYYAVPGLVNTNILGKSCKSMVPQGVCKMENYLLITAYDSEKKNNSVIYVLDGEGTLKATLVYDKKCHMGGIAYDGRYVWVAEGGKSGLGIISREEMFTAINISVEKKAKSVRLKDVIWKQVSELGSTSLCTYFDGKLWLGEFDKNYESHIYGYNIDYSDSTPNIRADRYIKAPKRTQGICFVKNNEAILLGVSISYGRYNNSSFNCYKLDDYYKIAKKDEIFVIDKGEAYKTIIMPPMLEQISVDGEMLYCIFESGARKYLMNMDGYGYSRRPIGSYIVFEADKIFR